MTSRHAAPDREPGDLLVRGGAVVFALGLVCVVVAVVPAVLQDDEAPLSLVVAGGSLLPLGFALALVGLLRGARTRRRAARRAR